MVLVRAGGDTPEIERGGVPLGILPEFSYETQEETLQPGDVCVLFSDGITEQTDGHDREFGRVRLTAVVKSARGLSAEQIAGRIETAVTDFAGKERQADDFTLLVIKRTRADAD
jgi:sigma-B regulation protein RsbU (phosphoserine phosphatase)